MEAVRWVPADKVQEHGGQQDLWLAPMEGHVRKPSDVRRYAGC